MLLEKIQQNASLLAEHPAYRCGEDSLTYSQLWNAASLLAAQLQDGAGAVALIGTKQPMMAVGMLGSLLAGRPYLPLSSDQPKERLQRILSQANPGTVIDCREAKAEQWLKREPAMQNFLIPVNPSRDAYWLFTSGSSGSPKGVRISLAALENFVRWFCALPAIRSRKEPGAALNQAQFSFDLSVADLWPAWMMGETVFALEPSHQADLDKLYRALGESGATRMSCTPSFTRLCLCDKSFQRELMPALQTVFFCGETLPARTVRQLRQRFPGVTVLNAYGPTEATCAVCAVEVTGAGEPLPVGQLANAACQLLILDQDGNELPPGQSGEIAIAGQSVASGYLNASAERFGSWQGQRLYRTGDTGRIENGLLWYGGRLDRQLKYKGYRIEPGEIEAVIRSWPQVQAAAVLPMTAGGQVVALAAVVEWIGPPPKTADCDTQLRKSLPAYMRPKVWLPVERMPVNQNGKCDLQALKEMLQNG